MVRVDDQENTADRVACVALYDGGCGFCSGSMRCGRRLDWRSRTKWLNSRDPSTRDDPFVRRALAQSEVDFLSAGAQDRAMTVIDRGGRTHRGYHAWRRLAREFPLAWLIVPLLYVPPVPYLGGLVYRWIAAHRHRVRLPGRPSPGSCELPRDTE
jgi:predicted DCC family thiol-disulfide oxidoreductase YuxK